MAVFVRSEVLRKSGVVAVEVVVVEVVVVVIGCVAVVESGYEVVMGVVAVEGLVLVVIEE